MFGEEAGDWKKMLFFLHARVLGVWLVIAIRLLAYIALKYEHQICDA